jgi:DNA-3-methyladenine glycosylase I
MMDPRRCSWASGGNDRMLAYHDREWGTPSRDDRHLFEMLTLEGAQAGLSWRTILDRRDGYRRAFAGFDVEAVAGFDETTIARLMTDPSIVRNRRKIESAVGNARAVAAIRGAHGSLHAYLWSFVDGAPIDHRIQTPADIPSESEESREMSHALRRHGFRFVGPTICYAFMQATGMVNDHEQSCFRRAALGTARATPT